MKTINVLTLMILTILSVRASAQTVSTQPLPLVRVTRLDKTVAWQPRQTLFDQAKNWIDRQLLTETTRIGPYPKEAFIGASYDPDGTIFDWYVLVESSTVISSPYHKGSRPDKYAVAPTMDTVYIKTPRALHVRVKGPYPCECITSPTDLPKDLEVCAWRQAQLDVGRRHSAGAQAIYLMQRPAVRYIKGQFRGRRFSGHLAYGSFGVNDQRAKIPITIAVSGDWDIDFDSQVHEYRHWIINELKVDTGTRAALRMWVDVYPSIWASESKVPVLEVSYNK